MVHKLINYLAYATIILALGLLVWVFYTIIHPFQIVTLHKNPFKITTPVVARGEYVEFCLEFTKHYNIKPQVTYYLVDGVVLPLSGEGVSRQVGTSRVEGKKQIPLVIPPGKYKMQIDLVYEIVPWRKLYYSWQSELFEVK